MIRTPAPGSAIVYGWTERPNHLFIPLVDALRLIHIRRAVRGRAPLGMTWGAFRALVGEEEYAEAVEIACEYAVTPEQYLDEGFWDDADVEDYGWEAWYEDYRTRADDRPDVFNAYYYCRDVLPALADPDADLRDWYASCAENDPAVPAEFDEFPALIARYPEFVRGIARERYGELDLEFRYPFEDEEFYDLDGGDGDWPDWPDQAMRSWLPAAIGQYVGSERDTIFSGEWLDLTDEDPEVIAQALRNRGYVVLHDDAIVNEAAGFGRPVSLTARGVYVAARRRETVRAPSEKGAADRWDLRGLIEHTGTRVLYLLESGQFVFVGGDGFFSIKAAGGWYEHALGGATQRQTRVVRLAGLGFSASDAGRGVAAAFEGTLMVGADGELIGADDRHHRCVSTSGRFERVDERDDPVARLAARRFHLPFDPADLPGWVREFLNAEGISQWAL